MNQVKDPESLRGVWASKRLSGRTSKGWPCWMRANHRVCLHMYMRVQKESERERERERERQRDRETEISTCTHTDLCPNLFIAIRAAIGAPRGAAFASCVITCPELPESVSLNRVEQLGSPANVFETQRPSESTVAGRLEVTALLQVTGFVWEPPAPSIRSSSCLCQRTRCWKKWRRQPRNRQGHQDAMRYHEILQGHV